MLTAVESNNTCFRRLPNAWLLSEHMNFQTHPALAEVDPPLAGQLTALEYDIHVACTHGPERRVTRAWQVTNALNTQPGHPGA
jgi:hypothetical protein